MDGGSEDGTVQILQKFEERFNNGRYPNLKSFSWFSQPDNGQSDAINKGLRMATGEIVAFINSDDFYKEGVFQRVMSYFSQSPNCHFLTGRSKIVNSQNNQIQKAINCYKNFWLSFHLPTVLHVLNPISQPASFWRKTVHGEFGYFNEDEHLVMDEFWLKIAQCYLLHVIPEYLACFRIHENSKGSVDFPKQLKRELEESKSYNNSLSKKLLYLLHSINVQLIIIGSVCFALLPECFQWNQYVLSDTIFMLLHILLVYLTLQLMSGSQKNRIYLFYCLVSLLLLFSRPVAFVAVMISVSFLFLYSILNKKFFHFLKLFSPVIIIFASSLVLFKTTEKIRRKWKTTRHLNMPIHLPSGLMRECLYTIGLLTI
tara:strand:+ start:5532 stop:6644 length:1113 start_codon:yes stop_codon:yes gene_type:complete